MCLLILYDGYVTDICWTSQNEVRHLYQHLTWRRITAPSFIALSPTRHKRYRKSSGDAPRKEGLKQPSMHSPIPERTSLSWGSKEACKEGTSILGRKIGKDRAEAGKCRGFQGAGLWAKESREESKRSLETLGPLREEDTRELNFEACLTMFPFSFFYFATENVANNNKCLYSTSSFLFLPISSLNYGYNVTSIKFPVSLQLCGKMLPCIHSHTRKRKKKHTNYQAFPKNPDS